MFEAFNSGILVLFSNFFMLSNFHSAWRAFMSTISKQVRKTIGENWLTGWYFLVMEMNYEKKQQGSSMRIYSWEWKTSSYLLMSNFRGATTVWCCRLDSLPVQWFPVFLAVEETFCPDYSRAIARGGWVNTKLCWKPQCRVQGTYSPSETLWIKSKGRNLIGVFF